MNHIKFPQIGLQDIAILICLLGFVLIKFPIFANDSGLGWHLKTGEWIVAHQQIPSTDIFTFGSEGHQWLADQWLGDLVLYKLFELGGWSLLYVVMALLIIYTFLVSPFDRITRFSSTGYLLATLLVLYSFYLAQIHFLIRPVLFSFLCFQVLLYEFRKISREPAINRVSFLKIGITTVVWANCHPSFLLVWILFGGLLIAALIGVRDRVGSLLKVYGKLFLLILVATLITPAPLLLYSSMINLSLNQASAPFFEEWKPLTLGLKLAVMFPLGLASGLLIAGGKKIVISNLWLMIVSLILGMLSLQVARFVPYYAIAIVPLLYQIIADFSLRSKAGKAGILGEAWHALDSRQKECGNGKIVVPLITIAAVVWSVFAGPQANLGPSREEFPYQALNLLQKDAAQRQTIVRVMNDVNFGGFITGWGGGLVKAFIDDRVTLHGVPRYLEMNQSLNPQKIKKYALQHGADYLLFEYNRRNQDLISYFKIYQKDSIVLIDQQSILIKVKLLRDFSEDV